MKFVDISGFGHSGKGIISDLLKEFEGYQVPASSFEFNLVRIQGGLIDIQHALIDNWSLVRSDAAIRRFLKLIKRIGPAAKITDPGSLFLSNGMNYDNFFGGSFSRISKAYIESLINYTYKGEWPYPMIEEPTYKQFYQRIMQNVKIRERFFTTIYVAAPSPEDFTKRTENYLTELFNTVKLGDTRVMVMHNAIEPFNPGPGLDLFEDARMIVVQRDPRDIFASTQIFEGAYIPEYETKVKWKLKSSFLNTDNIDLFIERQLLYYSQVNTNDDKKTVLRLRYEDIILNYESSLQKIYDFLEESAGIHINKQIFFKPDLSAKNIGLWKKISDQSPIRKIEEHLSEYCFYQ